MQLREFDLDAALARKPGLLLLDELAHTNAPGSRHAKRWQDVEELLEAGIDVYTTLNVQHLESLNDLVNQITGVAVRETVPDASWTRRTRSSSWTCPPEELLKRLAEGKVYVPEQAARAVQSFFRQGNLSPCASWRCAAPRSAWTPTCRTTGATTRSRPRGRWRSGSWSACGPNPESARLVRAARRMAARLRAEWIVAYVESPAQPPLSAASARPWPPP